MRRARLSLREREFFIDNLLVRVHLIIVMVRWTGLAPWEFDFPFPGSLTSTFLDLPAMLWGSAFGFGDPAFEAHRLLYHSA